MVEPRVDPKDASPAEVMDASTAEHWVVVKVSSLVGKRVAHSVSWPVVW